MRGAWGWPKSLLPLNYLNLEEEEMEKLASLGHGSNHENAVQVLKRSLALLNKSYKELLAQCNLLGRAETCSQKKLDKTKEKIKKLQARLQEVEKTLEERENEILRNLKASKRNKSEGITFSCAKENLNFPCIADYSLEDQTGKPAEAPGGSKGISLLKNDPHSFEGSAKGPILRNNLILSSSNDSDEVIDLDADSSFFMDEVALEPSTNLFKHPSPVYYGKNQAEAERNEEFSKSSISAQGAASFPNTEASSTYKHIRQESWNSGINMNNDEKDSIERAVDRSGTQIASSSWTKEILVIDDSTKQSPSMAIKMEIQDHDLVASPGDAWLPGGIFGLEGGNRSAGKWCKQVSTGSSSLKMQASKSNGDLIAVGADGRGGTVKVLRAHDQFLVNKSQTSWSKRSNHGVKQSGQSEIDHSFVKSES